MTQMMTQYRQILTLSLVLGGLFTTACERELSGRDQPLRPLVYTELPPSETPEEAPSAPKVVNISPEDLGYSLFHALVDHNRSAYESMFVSGEALQTLIHMKADPAAAESARILKASELLWTLFSPVLDAEEPLGSLSGKLKLAEFRVGKGRNLAGKVATPEDDEIVQHWGNELRIELTSSEKVFVIRVPKIVKTALGWRIAQPIEMDPTLRIYLETGMYLKGDLITSEHYPFPLEVGNFWKYRVDQPERVKPTLESDEENAKQPKETTVTEMITSITRHNGYWIVAFEETTVDPGSTILDGAEIKKYSWLVTPRMIFPCMRDCRNNADNINYLLGYISRQTPLFVFPLEVGNRWTTAGRRENYNRYEVKRKLDETLVTPSGSFTTVLDIFGSIEEGRENRLFTPGIGVVQRTVRSGVGQKTEVLIKYRLI